MLNRFHVIKDPIHGSMQFTTEENNWIKPFIDSELFQRLRHIRQLGLADWIFPGALHNRFIHSLGCCYVASQISSKLQWPEEDRQQVILACLLHDIGHGPFSHAFEAIFWGESIKHEYWTSFFLNEYTASPFIDSFNDRNANYPLSPEKIMQFHSGRTQDNSLLCDIVSSQLDADRLDYLLRDSYFCGVTYGNYDFRWLLHCLTGIRFNGQVRLGITYKGIGVVEQYLMARRLMIRNVYQHAKKHGIEFLLQEFLRSVAALLAEDSYFNKLESNVLVQFLKRVNAYNDQAKVSGDLEKCRQHFARDAFPFYKQLCDYDVFHLIRLLSMEQGINHPAVRIAKRLQARQSPKVLRIGQVQAKIAKDMITEFMSGNKHQVESWQIGLIDLQHLAYQGTQDPILVQDTVGTVRYLQENSMIINALSDKSEDACVLCMDIAVFSSEKGKKLYNDLRQL